MTPSSTLAPVRSRFRALAIAFVPAATDLGDDGWRRGEAIIDEALAARPPGIRRQIVLFVRILDVLVTLRHGRSLTRVDPERLRRFLRGLEGGRVLLLRRGVWGLRTLAYMGYYGQDAVRRSVGYAADAAGWGALSGDAGPWRDRGESGTPEPTTLTVDDGHPHDAEPGR